MTSVSPTSDSLQSSAPAVDPQRQKLEKAAQEFEGMLLNSLWKSMAEDMKSTVDGDDSTNATFTDMGMQAISAAMAKAGGLGIGRMLLKALEKTQATEGSTPPVTAAATEARAFVDK